MARQAVAQAELEAETSSGIDVGLTDLLIVGPGVLGARLGQLWLQEHPQALVTAQTNTSHNHERCAHLAAAAALLTFRLLTRRALQAASARLDALHQG